MTGLFRANAGLFPIADIRSVQHIDARPGRCEHYVVRRHSTESTIELFTWDVVDLSRRPTQLAPAEPGTKLITVYVDPEGAFADTAPVLSWALCLDGIVRPLLPTGVRRGYSEHDHSDHCHHPDYVQMPDGGIYQYGCEADADRLDTVEAVLANELHRYEQHNAERRQQASTSAGEAVA